MRTVTALLAGVIALAMSFAQMAQAQQSGYKIRTGDTLRIEVLEDPGLNRSTLVAPDGRITLPLAGSVKAGGRTVEAVQAALVESLGPSFASTPTVFVAVEKLYEPRFNPYSGNNNTARASAEAPTVSVYVIGEALKPGRHAVAPGTTVLQLFAEMGGFSKFAATKRIQLRRTDPASGAEQVYALNYKAIEAARSPNGMMKVSDGDVIVVPQRGLFE